MNGLAIGLAIGGMIIGAIASFLASRHFFKKGVKEKLIVPYVQFTSKLFSEIDPELKNNLIVKYKGHKVENITQAQFLIANSGDVAIRDIIEPLKLTLPKENKIFSVNIIHIEPEGREVSFKIVETDTSNIVKFDIPLLNRGDFFVIKIVAQDTLPDQTEQEKSKNSEKDHLFKFSVTADDLPPKLEISHLPYSYYEKEEDDKYNWGAVGVAFFSGIITTFFLGTILALKSASKGLYLFSFKEFFSSSYFGFYSICILGLAIISLLTLLLTVLAVIGAILELTPDEKPKFKVPSKLKDERRFYRFDYFD